MIYQTTIIQNFKIEQLQDIKKMKELHQFAGIKINKSKIARELGVSRKTVLKYYQGHIKKTTRNKPSYYDSFYEIVQSQLHTKSKYFSYKQTLYDYLVHNYNLKGNASGFRKWIASKPEFQNYFHSKKKIQPTVRFETDLGQQAQVDWKENITFMDKQGEVHTFHVLTVLLGYSRYRYYGISTTKTQAVLLHHLTKAFEHFQGVPKEVVFDNMKTVMDEARRKNSEGKINPKIQQYAQDFGFKIRVCMARRPQTKGKVEAQMKVLDFIHAYQQEITFEECIEKIQEKNNEENSKFHYSYQRIPCLALEKEKAHLLPLPQDKLRRAYTIQTISVKVNRSSMVHYCGNAYSVSKQYTGKIVQLQIYDSKIYIYFNTKLITIHEISTKRLNYHEEHYQALLKNSFTQKEEEGLKAMAKENLRKIGGI